MYIQSICISILEHLFLKFQRFLFCFSQIGVHNGWCYVHSPHLLYLQRGFPQAGRHVSSINRQTLVLRGSLELTELVDNPHFVMILELEYLVQWGTGEVCDMPAEYNNTIQRACVCCVVRARTCVCLCCVV